MLYFEIDPVVHIIIGSRTGLFETYNTKDSSIVNGKIFLVEVDITKPAVDTEIERLSIPEDSYDYVTNVATRVYTVVTKTQMELDQERVAKDTEALRLYGKDTVLVLVQLVSKLLDDSVILASDFDPAVKDSYLEIKAIADRIIANQ